MSKKPVVLIIRDGWGINPGGKAQAQANGDATLLAKTPFHDHLYASYPRGTVSASGEDVGLPEGQMGNSEVGHLNLGAGRVVYQDLTRINKSIRDGELAKMPVLVEAFEKAKGKRLNFLGLISDGGVHSHQDHPAARCTAATLWYVSVGSRSMPQLPISVLGQPRRSSTASCDCSAARCAVHPATDCACGRTATADRAAMRANISRRADSACGAGERPLQLLGPQHHLRRSRH